MLDVMHMDNLLSGSLDFVSGCDNCTDMIMSVRRAQQELTHQYMGGCEECCSRDYPDDPVPSPDCGWRMSCHTRWSLWSGLQAAASRHWPPVRQGTPASSCHHVIMCDIPHMSLTSWTTTQRRGVSAPPTMVTPRLAEVRGISTWLTSPSRIGSRVMPATTMRTWNWKRNDMSKSTIQRNSNFLIYDDPLVLMCTFSLILLFLNSVLLTERAFCELKENDKDKWSLL